MENPDEVLTPEEAKRRASIRYILRRRYRANKQRANSRSIQKSWAEYSEVNFQPLGARSGLLGIVLILISIGLISLPILFVKLNPHRGDPSYSPDSTFAFIFQNFILWPMAGLLVLVIVVVTLSALWNIISSQFEKRPPR